VAIVSWDNKTRRWRGDLDELCPDDLLTELNGAKDYKKSPILLERFTVHSARTMLVSHRLLAQGCIGATRVVDVWTIGG
jgi:hypothetical protein